MLRYVFLLKKMKYALFVPDPLTLLQVLESQTRSGSVVSHNLATPSTDCMGTCNRTVVRGIKTRFMFSRKDPNRA